MVPARNACIQGKVWHIHEQAHFMRSACLAARLSDIYIVSKW